MQTIHVPELTPHPKNEYFFDDVTGQKWEEFLESIRTSGVIEPPVVTPVDDKYLIVSGHQRIRACKELGINEVNCEVKGYVGETDKIIKDLIETNVRQRGTIAGSDLKMGRIIKELERIYGIKNGGDKRALPQLAEVKSQDTIAQELGMSVDKLNRLKKLAELPEDYQEMLLTGQISTNTAATMIARLSEEEQLKLLNEMSKYPAAQKFTQSQVQSHIDQLKEKNAEIANLQAEVVDATRAAKASTDSEEYIRAKKAREEIAEQHRQEYEKRKVLEAKTEDQAKQINMLRDQVANAAKKLAEMQEQKEVMVEPEVEVREVEVEVKVYPEDYERLKRDMRFLDEENERLAALVAELKTDKNPQMPSGPVNEVDELEWFYDKVTMFNAAVVPEIDSIMVGAERFALMTPSQRDFIADGITRCIHSFNEMMTALKNSSNKEAA